MLAAILGTHSLPSAAAAADTRRCINSAAACPPCTDCAAQAPHRRPLISQLRMGNDFSCIHPSAAATCASPPAAAQPHSACMPRRSHHPLRRRRRSSRPLHLITIVSPLDGRARRFREPLNVGELMLAVPGHFVAELNGQQQDGYMLRSKRISALPADCNLCALHVYYLLPMSRLNTHLGSSELRRIVMATRLAPVASTAPYSSYPTHAASKIAPLSPPQCEEALLHRDEASARRQAARAQAHRRKLSEGDHLHARRLAKGGAAGGGPADAEAASRLLTMQIQRSFSKPRNWEPKLDTIAELRSSDD